MEPLSEWVGIVILCTIESSNAVRSQSVADMSNCKMGLELPKSMKTWVWRDTTLHRKLR